MTGWVDRLWYGQSRPLWPLYPFAWLYRVVAEHRRRVAWQARDFPISAPVIVVGNITAGGTGKSPLTAMLARLLLNEGWRPVILTRGYGGKADQYPLQVSRDSVPAKAGDEPVMLAQITQCPVVVDPDRRRGAIWALEQKMGNIILCDDGLQHYRLPRDIEIAVFDSQRGFGNGALIPVGPLRERPERLESVDFVITNGGWLDEIEHDHQYTMTLVPTRIRNLVSGEIRALNALNGRSITAVAGIGNPERFFDTLRRLGARVTARPFSDHHEFRADDLQCEADQWLVMTAKDAVKCSGLVSDNAWALDVEAELPEAFSERFMETVKNSNQALATFYNE